MTSVFWNFERQHEYLSGFAGDSDSKESACSAGDPGLIPGSGSSLGEGNGYPFQYFCLENSMDRGAWRTTVHGTAKRRTRPSNWAHTYTQYYKQRKKILTLFSRYENISPKKLFDCPNTTRWKKSHFAGPMAPFLIFLKDVYIYRCICRLIQFPGLFEQHLFQFRSFSQLILLNQL